MEFHPRSPRQTLDVRLLPDGRVISLDGAAYPAPATWRVVRNWSYGGQQHCLLRASVARHTYFADVPADRLTGIAHSDGVLVHLERVAGR